MTRLILDLPDDLADWIAQEAGPSGPERWITDMAAKARATAPAAGFPDWPEAAFEALVADADASGLTERSIADIWAEADRRRGGVS